ncbi:MAG: PD-(D/E)XK nuclease family protein [Halobacteriota archaeon]|nr:PD-(D/E)XK nuclease family protein [Halobacteriota archaeon]
MVELESWFYKYNAWSFSKHRMWKSCKLAYYYRYIGTALKSSKDIDVMVLKRLKDLKNKFAVQGIIIHEVLENQMGQHFIGRGVSEDSAKSQYVRILDQYRKTARGMIVEYYNGGPINEKFFDYARSDGIDKLGMFFGVIWPQFKDLEYLKHEKFDRFSTNGVECIVKADYVSKTKDDIIVVSDWKTGLDNVEYESELQIGVYVLWVMDYYKTELEKVRSEMVYLTSGKVRHYEFKTYQMESIKKQIAEDYTKMNESYEIEHFPPDPEPKKCLSCQFSTICSHSLAKDAIGG